MRGGGSAHSQKFDSEDYKNRLVSSERCINGSLPWDQFAERYDVKMQGIKSFERRMRRYFSYISLLILSLTTATGTSACNVRSSSGFKHELELLLAESGAGFSELSCYGGWIKREMHCEFTISKQELPKLVANLQLNQKLPYSESARLIRIQDGPPCSSRTSADPDKNFGIQQWVPARHGFASSILIYSEARERACLLLSIAFG